MGHPGLRKARGMMRGQRPDVYQVLAATESLPPAAVAEALAVDQWRRWHAGERVAAEEYLRRYPALEAEPAQALDLIYGEFLVRRELGEDRFRAMVAEGDVIDVVAQLKERGYGRVRIWT